MCWIIPPIEYKQCKRSCGEMIAHFATAPSSFASREWKLLFYAPQARRQDEWGRTMHHPGHRWYPYYSGTPRPWLRFIYRF